MGEAMYNSGTTKKYGVPLSHLDFRYIKECSDVKELEKIYRVLRSGDEGCFPELEKQTENKLTELAPNSRALRKEVPVSRLDDLDVDDRKTLIEDLKNWNEEMKSVEDGLLTSGSDIADADDSLPPIRSGGITSSSSSSSSSETKEKTTKRAAPRDYKEWEKVDIDKELEKAEAAEEERKIGGRKSTDVLEDLDSSLSSKGLSEEEKLLKANREKDKGNEAFRSGDYKESVLYYSRSISLLPTTASYNNRALAYLKLNEWEKSLCDLEKVLKAEPSNIKGLLRRGTAFKGKKDFKRAVLDLEKVLELEPSNKKAEDLLKEVGIERKKLEKEKDERKTKGRRMIIEDVEGSDAEEEGSDAEEEGEPKVNGHVKSVPDSENVAENVILENDSTDEPGSESKINCEKTEQTRTEARDTSSETQVTCAETAVKSENSDQIVKSEDVQDLNPAQNVQASSGNKDETLVLNSQHDSSEEQVSLRTFSRPVFHVTPLPDDVAALRLQGNTLFRNGQYADALVKYKEAVSKLDKKCKDHEVSLSLLYSNQAACKLKTGESATAINDCTRALELIPHSIKPLLRRASAYETQERYRPAYRDYKHVLSIDNSVELAHQGFSRCQKHLKELDGTRWREKLPPLISVMPWEIPEIIDPSVPKPEAKPEAEANTKPSGTTLQPKSTATEQGSAHKTESPAKLQQPDATSLPKPPPKEELSETPEEKFDRLKAAGNKHVQKSEFKQAVGFYTECIETLPEIAVGYTNRALCYLRLDMATEALADCDKALSLESVNSKALYRRAQAKKMLKRYKECLADLLELLKIEPSNTAAKKEVEIVKQYYKKEFEQQRQQEPKQTATKESSSKPRRKMKIEEVEEDEEEVKPGKSTPPAKNKSDPKSPTSLPKSQPSVISPSQTSPSSTSQSSNSSRKSKKSKSKIKATSGTGLPITPPGAPRLEKATPYEFLQAWNSLKSAFVIEPFVDLLCQILPEDLPKLISSNFDGQMLHKIIGSVKSIVKKGDVERGYLLLHHLCKVERFRTMQMFMSADEKKDIGDICSTLGRHKTSVYSEPEITKLKAAYGS